MVLAYHVIFTAYGFWLPNDPRGSWSDTIRAWELLRFGPATKTTARTSVAHTSHNQATRQAAKSALKYDPVYFNNVQIKAIASGFVSAITRSKFILHACSILPDHVHLVLARPRYEVEKARNQLKGQASKALLNRKLHPFANIIQRNDQTHSPWADEGWDVYLNTPADIHRAIKYVQNNPLKENRPAQPWPFLTPYPIPQTPSPVHPNV